MNVPYLWSLKFSHLEIALESHSNGHRLHIGQPAGRYSLDLFRFCHPLSLPLKHSRHSALRVH
jgi:hypothetical protein